MSRRVQREHELGQQYDALERAEARRPRQAVDDEMDLDDADEQVTLAPLS